MSHLLGHLNLSLATMVSLFLHKRFQQYPPASEYTGQHVKPARLDNSLHAPSHPNRAGAGQVTP